MRTALMLRLTWQTVFALSIFCATSGAQAPPQRYAIPEASVITSLKVAGIFADDIDLKLPSPLSSTTVSPVLEVRGIDPPEKNMLRVHLRCIKGEECIPFIAVLISDDPARLDAIRAGLDSSLAWQPVKTLPACVRAGQRAVLLMEDTHMRITIPVISIDTGAVGAEIRVASLDRKQTFRGTVAADGIVRGVLP